MSRWKTFGWGIWATDDGGGTDIPVPPESARPIPGLCGGHCGGVAGGAPPDAALGQFGIPMREPPTNRNPKHVTCNWCWQQGYWLEQWRDARDGKRYGRILGCTSYTATCRTQGLSWRRVTAPTRDAPAVICWYRSIHWMSTILTRPCVPMTHTWIYGCMATHSPMWLPSMNLVTSLWPWITTVQQ